MQLDAISVNSDEYADMEKTAIMYGGSDGESDAEEPDARREGDITSSPIRQVREGTCGHLSSLLRTLSLHF